MKKLLLAFALTLSTTAFAGEVLVKDISQYLLWGSSTLDLKFEANEALGRAWVTITISRDPEATPDEERIKIPGLGYDAATSMITLEHEGQLVDCAKVVVKGRGIFKNRYIKPTGRCEFEKRVINYKYDNGFEIVKSSKTRIAIIVK
jgi:hypothetical protein